jgi:hypothetical protein
MVTVTDCVVAPLLHAYELADDEVSVTESPRQNVVGPFGVIAGVGFGLTDTETVAAVPVHPFTSVTVTS